MGSKFGKNPIFFEQFVKCFVGFYVGFPPRYRLFCGVFDPLNEKMVSIDMKDHFLCYLDLDAKLTIKP